MSPCAGVRLRVAGPGGWTPAHVIRLGLIPTSGADTDFRRYLWNSSGMTMSRFWSLPVAFLGRASRTQILRILVAGHPFLDERADLTGGRSHAGLGIRIAAPTSSPRSLSGIPITAAAAMAGCS